MQSVLFSFLCRNFYIICICFFLAYFFSGGGTDPESIANVKQILYKSSSGESDCGLPKTDGQPAHGCLGDLLDMSSAAVFFFLAADFYISVIYIYIYIY